MGSNRIDTHVHVIPPSFKAAIDKHGDPSGWPLPKWSLDSAVDAADKLGVRVGVLSVTAPGPAIVGMGKEGRELARKCNVEVAELVAQRPGRFAFFGSLPDMRDVEGTLLEIDHVMNKLRAPGVVMMTSYGDKLLGDKMFAPIWDKLDSYSAVVFVHPSSVDITPKLVEEMPQPIIDYPQATTRSCASLIVSRTLHADRKFKVILSHAGGTAPFLADRLGMVAAMMPGAVTREDVDDAFRLFYFDLALSTTATALTALLELTTPDKVVFGSDFPYAPFEESMRQTKRLDLNLSQDRFRTLHGVNCENADALFPGGVRGMLERLGVSDVQQQ